MRRSIRSMVRGMAVVFSSHLPYTALHNEGAISLLPSGRIPEPTRKPGTLTPSAHIRAK